MKRKKQKHKKQVHLTPQQAIDREYQKSLDSAFHSASSSDHESVPYDIFDYPAPVTGQTVTDQKKQSDEPSLLITVSKLCLLLDCSRSTIIRMEKSGELPGRIEIGGSVRYHRETIEQWLRDKVKSGKVL